MRYKDVKATEYTWPTCPDLAQALARDGRRFSLELAPKLIASNGSLVELLITSDIGKYLEFRLLASIFLFVDHLEQVSKL
jgi:RAB protein geranylgeranyltransferase component A